MHNKNSSYVIPIPQFISIAILPSFCILFCPESRSFRLSEVWSQSRGFFTDITNTTNSLSLEMASAGSMPSSDPRQDLKNLLECSICLETFDDPRTLQASLIFWIVGSRQRGTLANGPILAYF